MNTTKDWHQSMTIWGGILATSSALCTQLPFGAAIDGGVAAVVAAIGGLLSIIGRMRASTAISAPMPAPLAK